MGRRLRTIHKWSGLGFAVLLVAQAGTGLVLAHREGLQRFVYREALADAAASGAPAAGLDVLVANVRAELPDMRLERIVYPRTGGVLTVRLYDDAERMHIAHVEPRTGSVLASGPMSAFPIEVADRIHISLMMGSVGRSLLLVEGLVLTFMVVTGVWLWWPRARQFARSFTIHWKSSAARLIRDLHVVPGVVVAAALLVSAVGGTLMVSEDFVRPVVSLFAPVSEERSYVPPPTNLSEASVGWQQALERVRERFPDDRLRQIRPFGPDGRMLMVLFVAAGELNPRTHHIAGFDRYTDEVLVFATADDRPAGDRFMDWFLPVHTGEIYGAARSTVLTAVALVLLALSTTGVLMWWRQRRMFRRATAMERSVGSGAGA